MAKKKSRKQSQSIQTYIQTEIDEGVSLVQIRDNLKASGWTDDDLKQEFQESKRQGLVKQVEFEKLFSKKEQRKSQKFDGNNINIHIWSILKESIQQLKTKFWSLLSFNLINLLFHFNVFVVYVLLVIIFLTTNVESVFISWLKQTAQFDLRLLWRFFLNNHQSSVIIYTILPALICLLFCIYFSLWTKVSLIRFLKVNNKKNKQIGFFKAYQKSIGQILPTLKVFSLRRMLEAPVYLGMIVMLIASESGSTITLSSIIFLSFLALVSTVLSLTYLFFLDAGKVVLMAFVNSFEIVKNIFWQVILVKIVMYLSFFFICLLVALSFSLILNQFSQVIYQFIKMVLLLKLLALFFVISTTWSSLFNFLIYKNAQLQNKE